MNVSASPAAGCRLDISVAVLTSPVSEAYRRLAGSAPGVVA